MKHLSILVLSFTIFGITSPRVSQAAEDHEHSIEVCSTQNQNVCAHLGFIAGPLNSHSEGQFVVHFLTPANSEISNLTVELWMNMGDHSHGSAPVSITPLRPKIYKITEAYFVMDGEWQVQIRFDLNGAPQSIDIPVLILE